MKSIAFCGGVGGLPFEVCGIAGLFPFWFSDVQIVA